MYIYIYILESIRTFIIEKVLLLKYFFEKYLIFFFCVKCIIKSAKIEDSYAATRGRHHTNQYIYSRERRRFGRQCLFSDRTQLLVSINPQAKVRLNYILRNPTHRKTHLCDQKALSSIQTQNIAYYDHGMFHYEGGWPKEVNVYDDESTLRYRKKIEREDTWGQQVTKLVSGTSGIIEENNSVNIYQEFFIELPSDICEDIKFTFEARQNTIFHDPHTPHRRICVIDWSPNDINKLFALHTNMALNRSQQQMVLKEIEKTKTDKKYSNNEFYIWDTENALKPTVTFACHDIVHKAFFCPKDDNWIAGGLETGKINLWDVRSGGFQVSVCKLEAAHREAVSAVCWVHSKTNTEFYTGSLDGSVKYWDGRDMEVPLLEVLLDPTLTDQQSRVRAEGVTVLEFEYTIPVRFIAGSDMGSIFIGNRKGMTPTETLAGGNYRIFNGPVRTVERNPFFVKNFLLIGDWCWKIWSEECKGSPTTLLVRKKNQVLCGTWSTVRCSLFVTGDANGELDFWDLLLSHRKPIFTLKFSHSIACARFRGDGEFLAVGLVNGDIHLLELDPALKYSSSKDKTLLAALFEREQLRCKLLEGRVEEIKLKRKTEHEVRAKAKVEELLVEEPINVDDPNEFLRIITSDDEFRDALNTFQDMVLKVIKQRQEQHFVMERTCFETEYIDEANNLFSDRN